VLGDKRSPRIVFEHPGESTIPTSIFVCDTGGMVVVCAGTTGYNATVDLRYLWMRQKRLQGSHFANDEQADGVNRLVLQGLVDPCLSRTFTCEELPMAHQLMYQNKHPHGNMSILIGATEFGQGISESAPRAVEHVAIAPTDTHTTPTTVGIDMPLEPAPDYFSQHLDDLEPVVQDDGTLVKELMHRGVISCKPTDTLEAVAKVMVDNKIHSVIVMDEGQPVGVVSQTDMALARQGKTAEEARHLNARAVMTLGYATCDVNDTLTKAISQMAGRHIHRLVAMENGAPVGILSMTDVVRKLFFKTK
jgi:crotonyl-CoA carboxylase/reductase